MKWARIIGDCELVVTVWLVLSADPDVEGGTKTFYAEAILQNESVIYCS